MTVLGIGVLGMIAGWLVNLGADTIPEQRSPIQFWYTPLCQLPERLRGYVSRFDHGEFCQRRPVRHIVVWILCIALGWLAWQNAGLTLRGLLLAIQAWFFLLIAVIDLEHRLVLNRMLLSALPGIIVFNLLIGTPSPASALSGAFLGFTFFLVLAVVGRLGMGDVKLAGIIGLATGLSGVVVAIGICILAAGVAALFILIRQRFRRGQTMAYAPYLVLGAWSALFFGPELWRYYLELL